MDEKDFEEWWEKEKGIETYQYNFARIVWHESRRTLKEKIQKRSEEFMRAFMEGEMEGKDG